MTFIFLLVSALGIWITIDAESLGYRALGTATAVGGALLLGLHVGGH